jgi:hypothetical protein
LPAQWRHSRFIQLNQDVIPAPHVDRRNGVQLVDEEGCRIARIRRSQGSRDTAGKVVPAGTAAVVRSSDFLRASKRTTALATLVRQRRLTPSCGGHAPTAERTAGPARMIVESLTPRPGIREQIRMQQRTSRSRRSSADVDPKPTSAELWEHPPPSRCLTPPTRSGCEGRPPRWQNTIEYKRLGPG